MQHKEPLNILFDIPHSKQCLLLINGCDYDISESLKKNQGTSTTVSDGSSWTADRDGNIWVTKDGVTTKANITYQPGGGSGGSGGVVSGGRRPGISNTGGSGATTPPAGAQPSGGSTSGTGTGLGGGTTGSGTSETVDNAASQRQAYDQLIQDYLKQLQAMQGQKTATAGDQSDYIRRMYEQQLAANKAQLESDYNQNVSGLDSEASKIGSNYYEQRRQTQATKVNYFS